MPVIISNHHHNSKEGVHMIINTNIGSNTAARILADNTSLLQKSLKRLSTGQKIASISDNAAGVAVASRLSAQVVALDASKDNLANAVSYSQTQDGYLAKISDALQRMGELASLAMDGTKNSEDRALYDTEYQELAQFIDSIDGKMFNNTTLFTSAGLTVAVGLDSTGSAITYVASGITLAHSDYAAIDYRSSGMTYGVASVVSAAATLTKIAAAQEQLASDRAAIGANLSRLETERASIAILKDNLSNARSRIIDVDVAEESANFAKQQILVQSGTAMLAQANILPQSALRLIS
jgi:flagellin